MPLRILSLFRSSETGRHDGLSQPEREAIADLLHFCMYADGHIAAAEDKVIDDVVATFDWDPKISFDTFEARSIEHARRAKEDSYFRSEFIASIGTRLQSEKSRELARKVSKKLFLADGTHSDREKELSATIDTILK